MKTQRAPKYSVELRGPVPESVAERLAEAHATALLAKLENKKAGGAAGQGGTLDLSKGTIP